MPLDFARDNPERVWELTVVKGLVRAVVSVALLGVVLRSIDLGSLWTRVRATSPGWIALAIGSYAVMLWLSVWRWNLLLHAQHVEVGRRRLTESLWVSLFFNNFLPSNIGGDVVRVSDTAASAGSKTLATTIILVDRALGLAALVVVASAGSLAASLAGVHVPGARWLWVAFGAGLAAAVPVMAVPRLVAHALAPVRAVGHPWVVERAQRLEDAIVKFRAAPGALAGAFAGALAVQAIIVAFHLLVARGLAVPLPVFLGAVLIPVSLVVQMAPVSINGFGVREAVFAFFFSRFGLPTDAAVALSLVATGIVMIISLGGGVIFAVRRRAS